MPETYHILNAHVRQNAIRAITDAPERSVMTIKPEARSTRQNARFWAMLTDISRAHPGGRKMTPERWKAAIMQSFGHQVQFDDDLEGRPFPIGHKSSQLTVAQMRDMMEFMSGHFTPLGVAWSEPDYSFRGE